MRNYYTLSPLGFETYYLPHSQKYDSLRKRIEKFKKKHLPSVTNFSYWGMLGLGSQRLLHNLFLYKEDGVYYEFFTGHRIGTEKNIDGRIFLFGDVFKPILLAPFESDNIYFVHELTASQFASDIKKYLVDKIQLTSMMREYLELQHQVYLAIQQEKTDFETAQHNRNNCDADWLEKYLNKR